MATNQPKNSRTDNRPALVYLEQTLSDIQAGKKNSAKAH